MNPTQEVSIPLGKIILKGNLTLLQNTKGVVLFAHGSGSSRFSPRNKFVAQELNRAGLGTLLFDLLTEEEESVDEQTREYRFNIPLLAERLITVTKWLRKRIKNLPLGYFGASTGAAAALIAAAKLPREAKAVVSRGGRPDLALGFLPKVEAPTLCIVGGNDQPVIEMNEEALKKIKATKKLEIIPGATHLFEEPGALEKVAQLAAEWLVRYLTGKKK